MEGKDDDSGASHGRYGWIVMAVRNRFRREVMGPLWGMLNARG